MSNLPTAAPAGKPRRKAPARGHCRFCNQNGPFANGALNCFWSATADAAEALGCAASARRIGDEGAALANEADYRGSIEHRDAARRQLAAQTRAGLDQQTAALLADFAATAARVVALAAKDETARRNGGAL